MSPTTYKHHLHHHPHHPSVALCRPIADVSSKAATTTMTMAAGDELCREAGPASPPGGTPARENRAAGRVTGTTAAGGREASLLPNAAVSRGGFFASLATAALGSSAVLTATVLTGPDEASANGMLDVPPARLNNRYFLMRAGQGGADKEGRVQSHPIDKLHMDNRLTEQGVEEVCVCVSVGGNG